MIKEKESKENPGRNTLPWQFPFPGAHKKKERYANGDKLNWRQTWVLSDERRSSPHKDKTPKLYGQKNKTGLLQWDIWDMKKRKHCPATIACGKGTRNSTRRLLVGRPSRRSLTCKNSYTPTGEKEKDDWENLGPPTLGDRTKRGKKRSKLKHGAVNRAKRNVRTEGKERVEKSDYREDLR